MRSLRSVLLQTLAHHAGRHRSAIHPWQDLEHDLDMTPLEVVLVALEIEGIEDVDIDMAGLECVRTVGEFATFLGRAVARAKLMRA